MEHQLGNQAVTANDLTAAALNNIHQETINFLANVTPSGDLSAG